MDLPLLVACRNALTDGGPALAPLPTEVALGGLGGVCIAALLLALRRRDLDPSMLVLGGCLGMLAAAPLLS